MANTFKKANKGLVFSGLWADGKVDTKWDRKFTKKLLKTQFRRSQKMSINSVLKMS